jgi:hypothetical protein
VRGDVSVVSEVSMVTSLISRPDLLTRSFGLVHWGRMRVRVHVRVRACACVCGCAFVLCF